MKILKCPICKKSTNKLIKKSRSGSNIELGNCISCDFLFTNIDKSNSLKNNQLDQTRLKDAGMQIPTIEKDFHNGSIQSKYYIKKYFNNINSSLNILEIGCSWGYFLNSLRNIGHSVCGIEISEERRNYVQNKLKINCYGNVESLNGKGVLFDKIFLFYVIEYINDPKKYIKNLFKLLNKKGEIILITPNKNDAIINIWKNSEYEKFIIDEHVVNYFSIKSIKELSKLIDKKSQITNQQGYSFTNHLKWYLTNKPSTTGIVGGDNFTRNIEEKLLDNNQKSQKEIILSKKIIDLIVNTDREYKKIIEKENLGNIISIIFKNNL